jgi:hypothetical protein
MQTAIEVLVGAEAPRKAAIAILHALANKARVAGDVLMAMAEPQRLMLNALLAEGDPQDGARELRKHLDDMGSLLQELNVLQAEFASAEESFGPVLDAVGVAIGPFLPAEEVAS